MRSVARFVVMFVILGCVSHALGSTPMFWEGADGDSWTDGTKWFAEDHVTPMNRAPQPGDWVGIGNGLGNGPTLFAAETGTTNGISIDPWVGPAGSLTIDGGDLVLDSSMYVGQDGSDGTLDIISGSLTVPNEFRIGVNGGSDGTLTMSGGLLDAAHRPSGGNDQVIGWDGTGHIQLDGGLIMFHWLDSGPGFTMDITGGVMQSTWNDAGSVQGFIDSGQLTGYGGAGTVEYQFVDSVGLTANDGYMEIWAVPEPSACLMSLIVATFIYLHPGLMSWGRRTSNSN
jgi:hypothetical protein